MVAMMWNSGCHSPALRCTATAASGTTWPSIRTSCEPVPRMPSVRQVSSTFTCGEFIGTPKCSTIGGSPGSLEHRAGHQEVAGRRAGGEDLARGDAVAALDLLGLAGAADPVRAAARQQEDALARRCASAAARPRPPSDASSARPEWPPGACAWRRRARSSRNDRPACAAWRPARRCRRRRRRARAARRPRPGPTLSAARSCRRRTCPRRPASLARLAKIGPSSRAISTALRAARMCRSWQPMLRS